MQQTPTPLLPRAPISLVLRAWDRNANEVDNLENRIAQICRDWCGGAFTAIHDRKIQIFSEALYFGCTLLLAKTTLGEEQSGLRLVHRSGLGNLIPPSRTRLIVGYICHLVFPHILRQLLMKLFPEHDASDGVRRVLLTHVAWWWLWSSGGGGNWLSRMLSIFAPSTNSSSSSSSSFWSWWGNAWAPESVGARVSGLNSVSTDTRMYHGAAQSSEQYAFLGGLTLLRLAVETYIWYRNRQPATSVAAAAVAASSSSSSDNTPARNQPQNQEGASSSTSSSQQAGEGNQGENSNSSSAVSVNRGICPLCLEGRQNPTAVSCGHVFCWSCLSELLEAGTGGAEPRCPLCREVVRPQGFVLLQNFAIASASGNASTSSSSANPSSSSSSSVTAASQN